MYYEHGLTQDEISDEVGVSRPTVSRLLSRAVQTGIVRFVLREPSARHSELENLLEERLGLETAVLVSGPMKTTRTREILRARAALDLLEERLQRAAYIGLGWGRQVMDFVEALEQKDLQSRDTTKVVPLVGASGQSIDIFQSNELVRRAAKALGAPAQFLHAPALVKDSQARATFLEEPSIEPVREAW